MADPMCADDVPPIADEARRGLDLDDVLRDDEDGSRFGAMLDDADASEPIPTAAAEQRAKEAEEQEKQAPPRKRVDFSDLHMVGVDIGEVLASGELLTPGPTEPPPPDEAPPHDDEDPGPDDDEEPPSIASQGEDIRCTDLGNARRLAQTHAADFRHCPAIPGGGWLAWTGSRWVADETRAIVRAATTVAPWWRSIAAKAGVASPKAIMKHANKSEMAGGIEAMISLLRADLRVAARVTAFDADPWTLNTPTATLGFRDGGAWAHRRGDLLMKQTGASAPTGAGVACPDFIAFLHKIMDGDADMIAFLQRAIGYSLTGDTSEQCLFILHGNGANGKTTFVESIRHALGDYAMSTPMTTFMRKREEGIPNDIARLVGARFVTASETQEGGTLNETLVKQATGGEVLDARYMRAEWFTFAPTFKVWMSTNHKPTIKGTDNGIWRRLRLIPFNVSIPAAEQDRQLTEKLRREADGILAWALDGCAEWQREGLRPPASVLAAGQAYRAEMDVIQGFLDDCCDVGPAHGPTSHRSLYAAFEAWHKENHGAHVPSPKWFGQQLEAKEIRMAPGNSERRRLGVGLIFRPVPDGRFAPHPAEGET